MWRVGLALAVGLIGWTVTAANFPEDLPTRTIAWFVLADPLLAQERRLLVASFSALRDAVDRR